MFNFTAFIRKKWSEVSESSGQKGTVIDELAVKPSGIILGDFYNSLASEHRINDVTNWQNMSEQELDFFGNKFFEPRVYGDYAFGYARIWFDQKVNIEITADTRFISSDGLQYQAIQPGYINSGSFLRSTDRFAIYYIDVPIIATVRGGSYNIDVGGISQITNIDFTYKMVSNPEAIKNGSKYENNEQYFKRLTYAINDRSLMNKRSIYARLPEFFPIIRSQYIASAGDRYMNRDLVEAIDLSAPPQQVTFLGKVQGENLIKSIGFYQIYPFEAGNVNAGQWGPLSIPTDYDYPLTIEPSDINSQEPAFHGYALNQECTDDMYKGIFFDDYKTYMEVATKDLFNIIDENVGYTPVIVPSPEWIYGANGFTPSNLGPLADGAEDIKVLNFTNNTINICGGALNSLSVGKDINKRIGVKLSGTFTWPDVADDSALTANSNLQIMIGGTNDNTVDGYTGIGFGIRINNKFVPQNEISEGTPPPNNASIYFAHAEKYGTAQVYLVDEDEEQQHTIGDINALFETLWRIEPLSEYEFEFIIYDDLRMTLYLHKTAESSPDTTPSENVLRIQTQSALLSVYGTELRNISSTRYGTMMKISLDTKSLSTADQWQITNLKAFDISEKKATAMFALNVEHLDGPITLYARANGSSAINNTLTDGFQAYIWDKEGQSVATGSTELTSGAWTAISGLSNPDGSKNSLESLFTQDLDGIDRYKVLNRFGTNIFILFITTGTTKLKSRYSNETEDDIHSVLHIDYIKAESGSSGSYHANNKSDIYVATLSNYENLISSSITLTKQINDNYFEMSRALGCNMPIIDILSVTIGATLNETKILSNSDYTVMRSDLLLVRSSKEIVKIYLNNIDSDSITVEYTTYPSISAMQDFFEGPIFGRVYGDILVKHKSPISLSFAIYYTGKSSDNQVTDAIKKYFDDNIDGVFVVKDLVSYLYNQNIVNNIQEPITVSYIRYDNLGNLITGTFTDQLEANSIEFFRITSLSATTL